MRGKLFIATTALATAALATPLAGQVVRGHVLDAETEAPVSGARIVVRDQSDSLLTQTIVDASGEFALLGLPEGVLRFEVAALGYTTALPRMLQLGRGGLFLNIRLKPEPLDLQGLQVTVEVQDPFLRDNGFYQRRKIGHGRYMPPERLAVMSIVEPSEIFRRILGMRVSGGEPRFTRGPVGLRGCRPAVYQDGILVRPPLSRVAFNDVVVPHHLIRAVETYSGAATAPPQWRGDAACGVIAVWTKH